MNSSLIPFVLLLLLVAVAGIGYLVYRSTRKDEVAPRRPDDVIGNVDKASIDQLKQIDVGDVIRYEDANWFVRGRLDIDEHGYNWTEHMLDDADQRQWLSIEDDEGFKVSLWRGIADGDIEQGAAGDRDVIVGSVAYRLQEQGTARYRATGATGTAPEGELRYADYRSVDGRLLGFENFGGRWEAALGEDLQPWELTVFGLTDRKGTL